MQQNTSYKVKSPWLLFFGLAIGSLMSGIDFLGIAVVIDPISKSLGIDIATLQWILTAFAIGNSSFLVTSGRLCDLYGRKMIFITGSLIFILSSFLIAISTSPLEIIFARLVQGASSGITTSASIAILATIYTPAKRTRWIAGLVGTTGLGMILGPALGGLLTHYFSWRLMFMINVPVGLFGLLLTQLHMPKLATLHLGQSLNLPSMALFTTTLIAFTIGISQAPYWGWASLATWLTFLVTLILSILFVYTDQKSHSPLIDLPLFKVKNFLVANGISACLYFTLTAWILLLGLYLQRVAGMSPLTVGLSLFPFGLIVLLLSTQISKIASRIGLKNLITLGALSGTFAFAIMAILPLYPSYLLLFPLFLLYGACFVIINASTMQAALEHVPPHKAGIASGKSMMVRWLSGAIGAAVMSTIFTSLATATTYSNSLTLSSLLLLAFCLLATLLSHFHLTR